MNPSSEDVATCADFGGLRRGGTGAEGLRVCSQELREGDRALAIVSVVKPSTRSLDVYAKKQLENACDDLGSRMEQLRRRAHFAGFDTSTQIRWGEPVAQIVQAAEEWGADLIVTGCRPKGSPLLWLCSSVSDAVRARARCGVLIVR